MSMEVDDVPQLSLSLEPEELVAKLNEESEERDTQPVKEEEVKDDEKPAEDSTTNNEEKNDASVESVEEKPFVEPKEEKAKEDDKPPEIEEINDSVEDVEIIDLGLIADAKEDLKSLDILVCGTCHTVFHFIEAFQEHKTAKCTESSRVEEACQKEGKVQVWAYTLWKHAQLKGRKGAPQPFAWTMYQNWCKLSAARKQQWLVAGETLQMCQRIGTAKINEIKSEGDPLALDETNAANLMTKTVVTPIKLNNDVTILPSSKNGENTNKAFKILRESIRKECTVEKIIAKRFNPRRKTHEYHVKWENFDTSENTWEPPGNLTACKAMIEEFEEHLKNLKAEQKLNGTGPKGRGRPKLSASQPKPYTPTASAATMMSMNDLTGTPGRPQRASKQKALNQVKSWCGNISDADDSGGKRPFDDDDSDDSFEKKMRLEDYSDSDEEKPKFTLKRITKPATPQTTTTTTILNNGLGKLPQNVLIPDANGVVRINQKQLPSLSTGVYIMSKTAGIIKLDSTQSKAAVSGGQTIVKVAPKIGQTHIKIVKKDGQTTNKIIQISPKPSSNKTYKPVITKIRRSDSDKDKDKANKAAKKEDKPLVQLPAMEEDSDDGLPELDFPMDMPLPAPDSPPGDFTLDPATGKVVGAVYPEKDKPVVIHEPTPASIESSLENIVKLAAADITEEDLKGDPPALISTMAPIVVQPTIVEMKAEALEVITEASDNSILNKALTNSNILQKAPVRPRAQPTQKILNHSFVQRTQPVSPIIRQTHSTPTLIRQKQMMPRPKFNIASNVSKAGGDAGARNVFSKNSTPQAVAHSNLVRHKVGQTTVYRSVHNSPKAQQSRLAQSGPNVNVYKASPRKEVVRTPPAKPKAVISMPSLIGDDDQVMASTSAQQKPVVAESTAAASAETDLSSFTMADNENPIFITGDDGTVYQVAGQNEQGQTILITEGSDGQQQCLLVTNDPSGDEAQSVEEAESEAEDSKVDVGLTEPLSVKTEDTSDQVVAQVVRAEPPSPGGTHKVVVMLPDGNLMVTQVSPEEYASLELE